MQRFDLNQNWEYLESSLQNPLMVGMLQGWKKQACPMTTPWKKHAHPRQRPGWMRLYGLRRSLLPQELYRGTGNHRPALLAGI